MEFFIVTNFPQPNIHTMFSAPGNSSHFDVRRLPHSAMFYGIGHFNGVWHHHHPVPSFDTGVAPGSNTYNPHLTPSSENRGLPVSINHCPSHRLPSSSNHPVIGVSTDEYGRENHFYNPYSTPSSGNRGFPVSIYNGPSDQLPFSSNHPVIGVSTDQYGRENRFYHPYSTPSPGNRGFPVSINHGPSHQLPSSSNHRVIGAEAVPRHPGPVVPTGIRTHRSHQGGVAPEASSRHGNLSHLRMLPGEEVAILDFSAFHQVEERFSNVSSGLLEETIANCLKTRTYKSSTCLNLEEAASRDEESDCCIICQEEYQNEEKIGFLDCGHEYHAVCMKKWLLVKNVCPLCKGPAVTLKKKDV